MRGIVLSMLLFVCCLPRLWGQTWQYKLHEPTPQDTFYLSKDDQIYQSTLQAFLQQYKLDKNDLVLPLTLVPRQGGFFEVTGNPVFKDIFGGQLIRIDSQEIRYKLSDTATQSYTFINGKKALKQRTQAKAKLKQLQKIPRKKRTKQQQKELNQLLIQDYDYYDLAKNHRNLPAGYYHDRVRIVEFVGKQKVNWCGKNNEVYIFYLHKDTHSMFIYYLGFVPGKGLLWIGASRGYGTVAFFELACPEDHKE